MQNKSKATIFNSKVYIKDIICIISVKKWERPMPVKAFRNTDTKIACVCCFLVS